MVHVVFEGDGVAFKLGVVIAEIVEDDDVSSCSTDDLLEVGVEAEHVSDFF